MDTAYAACTLGGARCKHQVLRHNVEEIQRWPSANCHHVHDPQEWTPYTCDGRRVYPSKEEAEYTAVLTFAIAVSASWWAVRKGLAKLQVPRMPTFLSVGRREHWLDMDPRAMREWAMAPLAVTLGLTESLRAERRGVTSPKACNGRHDREQAIYVGRGSFHHRLSTTKELQELAGLQLLCDCPMNQLCEADFLIGLYFDATTPDGDPASRGTDGKWSSTLPSRSHDTSSGITTTAALQLGPRRPFRASIAESAATIAL